MLDQCYNTLKGNLYNQDYTKKVHWGSCMYNMSSSLVFSVQRTPNRTSYIILDNIVKIGYIEFYSFYII